MEIRSEGSEFPAIDFRGNKHSRDFSSILEIPPTIFPNAEAIA